MQAIDKGVSPPCQVAAEQSGQRIDNFLVRLLKPTPKTRIYRMLRRGEVRVNGGRVKPSYRMQAGDRVRLPPASLQPNAQAASSPGPGGRELVARLHRRILFEDEGLLAIDKPAGVAVHGGSGVALGVIEALRNGRPGRFLELAHRLDRDTSGCLLLAKSRRALLELHRQLRAGQMAKSYELLVAGRWPKDRTEVNLPLHRYRTAAGERRVRPAVAGKPARTGFTLLRASAKASWLQARLHTGRTHQIRVHAAAAGHPLLGEDKYETPGSSLRSKEARVRRLCLHALSVRLAWGNGELRLEAPLPRLFDAAWRRLAGGLAEQGPLAQGVEAGLPEHGA